MEQRHEALPISDSYLLYVCCFSCAGAGSRDHGCPHGSSCNVLSESRRLYGDGGCGKRSSDRLPARLWVRQSRIEDTIHNGHALPDRLSDKAIHSGSYPVAPTGWKAEDNRSHQPLLSKLSRCVEQDYAAQSAHAHFRHSGRRLWPRLQKLPAYAGRSDERNS